MTKGGAQRQPAHPRCGAQTPPASAKRDFLDLGSLSADELRGCSGWRRG